MAKIKDNIKPLKIIGTEKFYKTPQDLQDKIDEYFKTGRRTKLIYVNDEPIEVPRPTISGLAYYLGFASRQSIYDYEEYTDYSYTIKRARLFIELEYEELLRDNNVSGIIFALKNLGWKDTQYNVNDNHDHDTRTDEEIIAENERLAKLKK